MNHHRLKQPEIRLVHIIEYKYINNLDITAITYVIYFTFDQVHLENHFTSIRYEAQLTSKGTLKVIIVPPLF